MGKTNTLIIGSNDIWDTATGIMNIYDFIHLISIMNIWFRSSFVFYSVGGYVDCVDRLVASNGRAANEQLTRTRVWWSGQLHFGRRLLPFVVFVVAAVVVFVVFRSFVQCRCVVYNA